MAPPKFRVDDRTDEQFRSQVIRRTAVCGCGDHGHRKSESWCQMCRACADCCQCGDGFEPVRAENAPDLTPAERQAYQSHLATVLQF